jgi:hypothetical protein
MEKMQVAYFESQTDLEIGDIVYLLNKPGTAPVMVYDIRCIHELRTSSVYFEFVVICGHGQRSEWLTRSQLSERVNK